MQKTREKRSLIRIIMCGILLLFAFMCCPITSHAAGSPVKSSKSPSEVKYPNVKIDEATNMVLIETYDLKKVSKIYYQTIGVTVSRCKIGQPLLHNGTASEYIETNENLRFIPILSEDVILTNGQVYDHMIIALPMSSILNEIQRCGYTDWYNEVYSYYVLRNSPDICYLKFDDIMRTINNGIEEGGYDFDYTFWGKVYTNYPHDNGKNPSAIQKAYGWRDPSGLEYHYNLFLSLEGIYRGTSFTDNTPADTTTPVSLYETKNYSTKYDISEAIPSSEEVTNVYSAASMVGNEFNIGTQTAKKSYSATYSYVLEEYYPEESEFVTTADEADAGSYTSQGYDVVDNGDGTVDVYDVTPAHTDYTPLGTETYHFNAEVSYQYIKSAPQIYRFESATVKNDTFPNRAVTYTKENSYVPDFSAYIVMYNKNDGFTSFTEDNSNIDSYNYTAGTTHYGLAGSIAGRTIYIDSRSKLAQTKADAQQECVDAIYENSWSRNDKIVLNDGKTAFTLMDNVEVTGAKITDGSGRVWTDASASSSGYRYGANYTVNKINTQLLASRASGAQTVTIPGDTDNADYPTGMEVTYKNAFKPADKLTMYAGKNFYAGGSVDSIYDHVMRDGKLPGHTGGDPADGYPIRIHTPVESPVTIVDSSLNTANDPTQLITGVSFNTEAENQLKLDTSYFIRWDDTKWYSAIYGEVEGYEDIFDKFVDNKYMRFPFEVVYDNKVYEVGADGFTDWIVINAPDLITTSYDDGADISKYESANHWQLTPFYIPSFAEEGGLPAENIYVECKVEALNVDGRYMGSHTHNVQAEINTEKTNYVALTRRCVQLSGVIYDFTIVGTDNKTVYTGEGLLDKKPMFSDTSYPMAPVRRELKSGVLNRLGLPYIRFLNDGGITDALDPNQTIPLRNGQSSAFSEMGDVWRAQSFAYTIKTIANLDGPNDSLEIIPTYTYITNDGKILESEKGEFKMYQISDNSIYEYDPADTSVATGREVRLNDALFKESYYDTADTSTYHYGYWVGRSVENENEDNGAMGFMQTITDEEYLQRKTRTYTLSHISIPSTLRYISGEYEQLAMNTDKQYGEVKKYDFNGYTSAVEKRFKQSMQQWQSKFAIPTSTKIIDTTSLGGASFDIMDYIKKNDFSWQDESIVDDGEGRMIINFDIIAYKDGKPYLQYIGGNAQGLNMWDREGYNDNIDPTLPLEDGDVVVIDMGRSMNDYYEPAIQNIN